MLSHADNTAWSWRCIYPDHEHKSWEEANCCPTLLQLLAQLQCVSKDTALSHAFPVMTDDYLATGLMLNPDESYSRIYTQLRELYDSTGQPEGPDEAGLWRWIAKICQP